MANPVRYFHSGMQGAPQLTNAWGDLTNMLDAVLANGFNLKTITSITSAAGLATANVAAGIVVEVNTIQRVAGADQAEYNGDVRVLSATSISFTYAIAGTPVSPATTSTSMTVKAAPLDFEIAFTATNKRAYRSKNVLSNRPYLRVDNALDPLNTTTYAKKGKVVMAESMTDIDTIVGASAPYNPATPTVGIVATGSGTSVDDGWYKWYYARVEATSATDAAAPNAFNRSWVIIGDDRGFYFFTEWNGNYGRSGYCFTDFPSFRVGDNSNTILCATEWNATASQVNTAASAEIAGQEGADFRCRFSACGYTTGRVVMHDHTGVGQPINIGWLGSSIATVITTSTLQNIFGYSGGAYPNPVDMSVTLMPILMYQRTDNGVRGRLPGAMGLICNAANIADRTVIENVDGYPDRKFMIVRLQGSVSNTFAAANPAASRMAFDITGPWY